MSNEYYNPSGTPANNSQITSPAMRAESALVQAGFDKMPGLSGKALKMVRVNAAGTGLESSGSAVITDGKTLTVNKSVTLEADSDGHTLTLNNSVTLDAADWTPTLSNLLNTSARTLNGAWYIRVGDKVFGAISASVTTSAAGQAMIGFTLPISTPGGTSADFVASGLSYESFSAVGGVLQSTTIGNLTWNANGASGILVAQFSYRIKP